MQNNTTSRRRNFLIGQLIPAMRVNHAAWKFSPMTQFDSFAENYVSLGKASYKYQSGWQYNMMGCYNEAGII